MSDHRDGPRLVNSLFEVFQQLPASQQAVFVEIMSDPTQESSADPDLVEEVQEARSHFQVKLASMRS